MTSLLDRKLTPPLWTVCLRISSVVPTWKIPQASNWKEQKRRRGRTLHDEKHDRSILHDELERPVVTNRSGGVAPLETRTAIAKNPLGQTLDEIVLATGVRKIHRQRDQQIKQLDGDVLGVRRYVGNAVDHGVDLARLADLRDDFRIRIGRRLIGTREKKTQTVAKRSESHSPRSAGSRAVCMNVQRHESHQ